VREKLTFVGILLGSLVCAAGCSGGSKEAAGDETSTAVVTESAPAETMATEKTASRSPLRCLGAAGLSDVEEQERGLWSGVREGRHYTIVVHKLRKPAKARTVVAGTYAVTGSFKVAAEGTELTSAEGLEADALVELVADCLSR
jgi:hypothetical protein